MPPKIFGGRDCKFTMPPNRLQLVTIKVSSRCYPITPPSGSCGNILRTEHLDRQLVLASRSGSEAFLTPPPALQN